MHDGRVIRFLLFLAVCVTCGGAGAAQPLQPSQVKGVAYEPDGSDAHRLDLYFPEHRRDAPLVIFVHGGAFMYGKRGEVAAVGEALARQGMVVAIPSYRLFPEANALGSMQDVAFAAAWVVAHARDYGVNTQGAFLAGHSAGAQIVAMIGTHGNFLEAAGSSLQAIHGVFALSGAYDLRDLSGEPDSWQRVDGHIYGETYEDRAKSSPRIGIDPRSPPIEAVCGTEDDPGSCPRTIYFTTTATALGVSAQAYREIGADHMGVLRAFIDPRDPLNAEFLSFIASHR